MLSLSQFPENRASFLAIEPRFEECLTCSFSQSLCFFIREKKKAAEREASAAAANAKSAETVASTEGANKE